MLCAFDYHIDYASSSSSSFFVHIRYDTVFTILSAFFPPHFFPSFVAFRAVDRCALWRTGTGIGIVRDSVHDSRFRITCTDGSTADTLHAHDTTWLFDGMNGWTGELNAFNIQCLRDALLIDERDMYDARGASCVGHTTCGGNTQTHSARGGKTRVGGSMRLWRTRGKGVFGVRDGAGPRFEEGFFGLGCRGEVGRDKTEASY
ncbi:hypothetical protein FB451DRAFT_171309 [Mycena latifolia]|nr:hypothetical protein FB451DRAFT_171309 [Mycena latifolia]